MTINLFTSAYACDKAMWLIYKDIENPDRIWMTIHKIGIGISVSSHTNYLDGKGKPQIKHQGYKFPITKWEDN